MLPIKTVHSIVKSLDRAMTLELDLQKKRKCFQSQIKPLLLAYHVIPEDISSGRNADVFERACKIILSTDPEVINFECKIESRELPVQIALLGDSELINVLLNQGFDPDMVVSDNVSGRGSLRSILVSLCACNCKKEQKDLFRNCLQVVETFRPHA